MLDYCRISKVCYNINMVREIHKPYVATESVGFPTIKITYKEKHNALR